MKLFSKIAFVCNLSFVLFVVLRYIEFNNKKNRPGDHINPLPFITGTLVVLGQLAIFVNFIFCVTALMLHLTQKVKTIPPLLVILNFLFLLLQVFYFFIY